MRPRGRTTAALTLAAAASLTSCDWLEDRFKTCDDVRVDLLNSQQTVAPIHLAAPAESFGAGNLLQSGESRSVVQCLQRGDRKEFRAGSLSGQTVGLVTCVAGRSSYEGHPTPTVVWFSNEFVCQEW
jgi:hypothetical protein